MYVSVKENINEQVAEVGLNRSHEHWAFKG